MNNYYELKISINPEIEDIVADICFTNLACEGVVLAEETYKDLVMTATTEGTLRVFLTEINDNPIEILKTERALLKSRGFTDEELGEKANLSGEWIDYEYRLQEKIEVHTPKCDLSTHTARRTFIVTALNEGVSTNLIMLITSHSDYKAMTPYIKATMKGTGSVIDALDKT